jgi:hypothetical protein
VRAAHMIAIPDLHAVGMATAVAGP